MLKNDIENISSQCQVVFFNWVNPVVQASYTLPELSDSTILDISKYVQEVTFSKTLNDAAGTFSIRLPNDRDWKAVLQRGTWGIIYMSNDDALAIPADGDSPSLSRLRAQKDKVRGIVYIDRVAANGRVGDERGVFDVDFSVTGRDFGVVYLENEIWYNRLYSEGKIQEAAAGTLRIESVRNVTNLLQVLHKAFFSPQELPGITLEGESITKAIPLQWLLPDKLIQALDLQLKDTANGKPYYGNIDGLFDFSTTLCSYPVDNPMTLINGKAWDRLKAHSIEPFHELFTETDDVGHPKLVFRYIPWKTSTGVALGKLNQYVKSMALEVAQVPVDAIDIIDFDLGEDTHSRYNYFLTTIDTSLFSSNDTVADFKDTDPRTGFPRIQDNSIRRYGLRLMYTTVNGLIQLGSEKADSDLLRLHNELMLEYWNNAVFMESGTIGIIGRNDVKCGKVLAINDNVPYNGGKVFYIEGYTDHFTVDDKGTGLWTQSLTVTRGFFPGSLSKRGEDYVDNGEFTKS